MTSTQAPLTLTLHGMLVLMAGSDMAWLGARSSRPEGNVRPGISQWILDYSNGLCAFCGEASDALEIGHIVSGGNGNTRVGWVAGNLGSVCRTCNLVDSDNGFVVAFETIMRPDLIPTVWPKRCEWAGMTDAVRAGLNAAKAEKRRIRGM